MCEVIIIPPVPLEFFSNHHPECHLSECNMRTEISINLNKCKQLLLDPNAFKIDMRDVLLRRATFITITWQLLVVQMWRLRQGFYISNIVPCWRETISYHRHLGIILGMCMFVFVCVCVCEASLLWQCNRQVQVCILGFETFFIIFLWCILVVLLIINED